MTTSATQVSRFQLIDGVRGFAVWLMIIFHITYDLKTFGFNQIDFQEDVFWWFLPRFIVFLFLICAGMSSYLSNQHGIIWQRFWPRLLKISVGALIISISTYLLFPRHWIYFGTLHCIALCAVASLPLIKRPFLSLVLALALLLPTLFGFKFWWPQLPFKSLDYIPFLPWFGVMCLGIFAGYLFEKTQYLKNIKLASRFFKIMLVSGQQSFWIYLLHQPIIYGTLWLFFSQRS